MSEFDNTNQESFNENFCLVLEYHLSRAFSNSPDKQIKRFWCDGILIPDELNQITTKGFIETKAWAGYTGQDNYIMTIKFGQCALNNYTQGLSLTDCLPDEETLDWVTLDIPNKTIELQLL